MFSSLLYPITKFLLKYRLSVLVYLLQIKNWSSKHTQKRRYYSILNSVLLEFLIGCGQKMDVRVCLSPKKFSKNTHTNKNIPTIYFKKMALKKAKLRSRRPGSWWSLKGRIVVWSTYKIFGILKTSWWNHYHNAGCFPESY